MRADVGEMFAKNQTMGVNALLSIQPNFLANLDTPSSSNLSVKH